MGKESRRVHITKYNAKDNYRLTIASLAKAMSLLSFSLLHQSYALKSIKDVSIFSLSC